MNVNPSYSLPFKVSGSYFVLGSLFYLFFTMSLYNFSVDIDVSDFTFIASVHLFMLGFVMMVIFGAMSQLIPVISEQNHIKPHLYSYIYKIQLLGSLTLVFAFLFDQRLLPLGALIVLSAMLIFSYATYFSVKSSKRDSMVVKSIGFSNLFLLFGILSGVAMAFSYAGLLDISPKIFLKAHIVSIVGGYVMLNVMGVSTVLLPMFGRFRRVSDNAFTKNFYLMTFGVTLAIVSSFLDFKILDFISFSFMILSVLIFLLMIFKDVISSKKINYDIWFKNLIISCSSLLISIGFFITYSFYKSEVFLNLAMLLFLFGFITFLIKAHLYKIVPFLVFFEFYSEYIGERDVPMLHEILDERLAMIELFYSVLGLILLVVSTTMLDEKLFLASVSFMLASSSAIVINIFKIKKVKTYE